MHAPEQTRWVYRDLRGTMGRAAIGEGDDAESFIWVQFVGRGHG
jgi:hypothetical protein